MNNPEATITYNYRFLFSNGEDKRFILVLDKKTLNLVNPVKTAPYPRWTELKTFKCPNCPLEEKKNKYCPLAVNIIELIDFFRTYISYTEVEVIVDTEVRRYSKHTSLQKGISSLMGIYMVTSGCPIMEKLKPMVRYHLPFATLEETNYRAISMYLLVQYFLYRKGGNPDWDLVKLANIYSEIKSVNVNICRKLNELKIEDAVLNAIVNLDYFAISVPLASEKGLHQTMENIIKIFS